MWSIGVLDPTRLDALLVVVTPLIESQIAQVDEIVITKVDECDEKKITWTRGVVARLNPDAEVRQVSALAS